jgi:hypothetical protein
MINFSRTEIEWLDTKFKKGEIDKIVTNMIMPSRSMSEKEIEKKYNELMHQAEYIMKSSGKMVLVTKKPKIAAQTAEKNGLKLGKEAKLEIGKEKLAILEIGKKTQNI